MGKIILFIIIVVFGSVGLVILSNQNFSKKDTNLKIAGESTPFPSSASISPKENNKPEVKMVTIKTSKGDIVLSLYENEAPKTVENFINKAKSGFYNNLTFHRAEDWVIQGGDPKGDGTGGGNMSTELNDKPFVIGSLGVARGQDIKISNDSQFFITKKEASWLNKQYTNFGMVEKGMDVVERIEIGDKILGIQFD